MYLLAGEVNRRIMLQINPDAVYSAGEMKQRDNDTKEQKDNEALFIQSGFQAVLTF